LFFAEDVEVAVFFCIVTHHEVSITSVYEMKAFLVVEIYSEITTAFMYGVALRWRHFLDKGQPCAIALPSELE